MNLVHQFKLGLATAALLASLSQLTASDVSGEMQSSSRRPANVYDVAYDGATARTLYGQQGTISRGDAFVVTGNIYPRCRRDARTEFPIHVRAEETAYELTK